MHKIVSINIFDLRIKKFNYDKMFYCLKQIQLSERSIIKRFYIPLYLALLSFFNKETLDHTAFLDIKLKLKI